MSESFNNANANANVLGEKDINTDMSGINPAGAAGGAGETDMKSMEYHRQVLASKMAAGK